MLAILLAQALSMPMAPVEVYKRAVAAMHNVQPPTYLAYDTTVTTKMKRKVVIQHLKHVERTVDRTVIAHDIDDPVVRSVSPFEIGPDLFLGGSAQTKPAADTQTLLSGLDDVSGNSLKTIGTVTVTYVHYSVQYAPSEDLTACPAAIHLKLEPLTDPLKYNLRELWVNPETARICQAIAVWRGRVLWKGVIAPITLHLDADGFLTQWSTAVSARLFIGAAVNVSQDGRYEHREPVSLSEWSAFAGDKKELKGNKP